MVTYQDYERTKYEGGHFISHRETTPHVRVETWWTEEGRLDAPDVMPAGSMLAPDWEWGKPMPSRCLRGEDWRWLTDPYSGARVRVPGDFDESLLR